MDSHLSTLIEELNALIRSSEDFKRLNVLDEQLYMDAQLLALASAKNNILEDYNSAIRFNDEERKKLCEKQLYEIKLQIDTHPLVQEYNLAYKELQKITSDLNKEIFLNFRGVKLCNNLE